MKKIILLIFSIVMILIANAGIIHAEQPIRVTVDGQQQSFEIAPQMINDRVMVPVRAIFEALGAEVAWDSGTETVTATAPNRDRIEMTIGQYSIRINGQSQPVVAAIAIHDDITLAPARVVAYALGMNIEWDGATRTVVITTPFDAEVFARDLFNRANAHRIQNSLEPFIWSEQLAGVTDTHVAHLVSYGGSLSTDADGLGAADRVSAAGLNMVHVADLNIRVNQNYAEAVFAHLISNNSRNNAILGQFATESAVTVALVPRDGLADQLVITQKFARQAVADERAMVQEVLELLNQERVNAGLPRLTWYSGMESMMHLRADAGYFGVSGNMAMNTSVSSANSLSPQSIVDILLRSDTNRNRLLDPQFTRIAIMYVTDVVVHGNHSAARIDVAFGTPTEAPPILNQLGISNLRLANAMPISSIRLPHGVATDAQRQAWINEFWALGGISSYEQEIMRLVNVARVENGVSPVAVDINMVIAGRYYTQRLVESGFRTGGGMGTAHTQTAYGGSRQVLNAFEPNITSRGGNAWTPGAFNSTPQAVVDVWLNSPGHRSFMLDPSHTLMGIGVTLNEEGQGFHYLFMGR